MSGRTLIRLLIMVLVLAGNPLAVRAEPRPLDTGDDTQSNAWGPGLALVAADGSSVHFILRPNQQVFETPVGLTGSFDRAKPVRLRARLDHGALLCEAAQGSDEFKLIATLPAAKLPAKLRAVKLGDDLNVVQTPGGLELRFDAGGVLHLASWRGQRLFSGGWPVIKRTQTAEFKPENVLGNIEASNEKAAHLTFHGAFVENDQHVSFVEQCTVQNDNQFTLRFDFTADTDLTLRMWRHYFALPVARYVSGTASAGDKRVTLPATFKTTDLLPASKHIVVETGDTLMDVTSSLPLSLVDHRAYGNVEEYLLAGYPVSKAVRQGTKWSVEMTVKLAKK